ncbi:MAG: hypothetical protein D6731_23605 [Planctomycetota bacterium]|nr:MAG: hypothetical protein D6731_23605 [Planctomycetota bacterium]
MLRQVNDVAIVDWQAGPQIPPLAGEVRQVLEAGGAQHVLVNMRGCDELRADGLETLTEVLAVCRDRDCGVGLFALGDRLQQLVRIMSLESELPPVLEGDESRAVAAVRNGGEAPSPDPQVEFEIDLASAPEPGRAGAGVADPASAPTARFDGSHLGPTSSGVHRLTPSDQPEDDLLTVYWSDLAALGYAIGGEGADEIMQAVAEDPSSPTRSGAASEGEEEGVLDLGDAVPARAGRRHGFVTEKLPVFRLDEESDEWSARPAAPPPAEFQPQAGLLATPGAAFGGPAPEFQAVDAGGPGAPPPAVVAASAQVELEDGDETVMIQPGALEAALLQAGLAGGVGSPAPAAAPRPSAESAVDGDETVMFQPGALDAALLAEVAKAAGPVEEPSAPPVEASPPARAAAGSDLSPEEQELRRFVHEHALGSPLHLQVLEHLLAAGERTLGADDLQAATGGERGAVLSVLEQFAQSRLVRRTRSVRVRGGTGFRFAGSPQRRGVVTRLLRQWADPEGRRKLGDWLAG